jgi:HTH-type transcriptional regulator / antitoxin HigA
VELPRVILPSQVLSYGILPFDAQEATVDIRPIKTDADYQAALSYVATLMDAKPNTPAGDDLDILTTLIAAYEEQHYPILPLDPVEALVY